MYFEKDFQHHTPIQIRFNDIDILGHVNNAVYQHFYDLARKKYFEEIIGEQLNWQIFGMVLASISIEYSNAIRLDESISVRTGIEMIGEKSLTMIQELYNTKTGELKSQNRAVLVGYSASNNRTAPVPESWKEKIFEYEKEVKTKYPA